LWGSTDKSRLVLVPRNDQVPSQAGNGMPRTRARDGGALRGACNHPFNHAAIFLFAPPRGHHRCHRCESLERNPPGRPDCEAQALRHRGEHQRLGQELSEDLPGEHRGLPEEPALVGEALPEARRVEREGWGGERGELARHLAPALLEARETLLDHGQGLAPVLVGVPPPGDLPLKLLVLGLEGGPAAPASAWRAAWWAEARSAAAAITSSSSTAASR
jgi:hypothetical protein